MKRPILSWHAGSRIRPLSGAALALTMAAAGLAFAPSSVCAAELLGYWDFNTVGSPGADVSGNSPDATLSAGATITPDGGGYSGAPGDVALDLGTFNNQGYARTAAGPHFDQIPAQNAYTVVLWQINRQQANTSSFWVNAPLSDGSQRGIQAHIPWGNGTLYFDQSGCCDAPERLTVNGQVILNQWQHFAFRRDSAGNRSIWVDGVNVAQAGGADPLEPFDGIVTIGGDLAGNNSFDGIIDEFAIFAGDLTDQEIMDLAGGASVADLYLADTDGDGMNDRWEDLYGLDKNNAADATADGDSDGLDNLAEYNSRTDPTDADSDDDGLLDGAEVSTHTTDPLNPDSDNDGLLDGEEIDDYGTDPSDPDTDGDGYSDGAEVADGKDPLDPNDQSFFIEFTFDTDDGGFTEMASGATPLPAVYDSLRGTWVMDGDDTGPATNVLTSPEITMPVTGGLQIVLSHRFSIEPEWDGTAIQFSRNGGPFVTVPLEDFTQNGYTFTGLIGNHVLRGEDGFNGDSAGYSAGQFIISIANFRGAEAGDTIQIQFLGAWDESARGAGIPNWEIDRLALTIREDTDADGIPDAYEEEYFPGDLGQLGAGDLDGDGLSDPLEFFNGTDPTEADTDADGSSDADEIANGTDPHNPDSDADGLLDGVETNTGNFVSSSDTGTDPNNPDTDGDGFRDLIEIENGGDPNDPNVKPAAPQITSLGTGTTALRGGDLTDPENDGVEGTVPANGDWSSLNWNWVSIQASEENYFGNFGGSEGAYDLFDNQVGAGQTKWCCTGPPQWLTVEFEEAVSIEAFTVAAGNDTPARDPLVWGIYGSNDNVTFAPIFEQNDTTSLWTQRLEVIEFVLPRPSDPYKFIRYEVTATQQDHQINEIEYFGTVGRKPLFFDVRRDGENLLLVWESAGGELYNVRSVTDPSAGEPASWPIYQGLTDLEAAPPFNMLSIPRPADEARFFAVESFPAPPVTIFFEDFENGQGDWTTGTEGAAGTLWELGTPGGGGPAAAYSPTNCFGTNLTSDYDLHAEIWLRSPVIDLSAAGSATLSFFHYKDIETAFDYGVISILDATDNSVLAVVDDNEDGFTLDWESYSKRIPDEGLGGMIRLEFRFLSDEISNFPGWYLDDVMVTVP